MHQVWVPSHFWPHKMNHRTENMNMNPNIYGQFFFSTLHYSSVGFFVNFFFVHEKCIWTKHKFHQTFIQLLTFMMLVWKRWRLHFNGTHKRIRQLLSLKFKIQNQKRRRDWFRFIYVWWSVGQWVQNHTYTKDKGRQYNATNFQSIHLKYRRGSIKSVNHTMYMQPLVV